MINSKSSQFYKMVLMGCILAAMVGCSPFNCNDDPSPTLPPTVSVHLSSPDHFPLGFVGSVYFGERSISGGNAPYTIGSPGTGQIPLPTWMAVAISATGEGLIISGTPDTAGIVTAETTLVDADGISGVVTIGIDVRPTNSLTLVGDWSLSIDVTEVYGAPCYGEENAPIEVYDVVVSQSGSMISISGIMESPANTLHGYIYSSSEGLAEVVVSGTYPEDGGTTTVLWYMLTVNTAMNMTGRESWEWDLGLNHCNGFSCLVMNKIN